MPLAQRIPKLPGFKNPFHRQFSVVNLSKLSRFPDGTRVDADLLLEAGLVHQGMEIKILGTGDLKRKLTVEAHFFSVSAREAIEKVGGSVKVLGEPRKIGPRRTAAKLPKPLPTAAEAAPAATTKAATTEKAEKAPRPERPAKQQREQGTPTTEPIEEATPPDEA